MRQEWRERHPGREHGFVICNVDGELVRGSESVGSRYGVSLNTRCPRGTRCASFHTHPGGVAEPSLADIREGHKHKMDICIGVPESGEVRCYRPVSPSRATPLR